MRRWGGKEGKRTKVRHPDPAGEVEHLAPVFVGHVRALALLHDPRDEAPHALVDMLRAKVVQRAVGRRGARAGTIEVRLALRR